MSLDLSDDRLGPTHILAVDGEIDLSTAPQLEQRLFELIDTERTDVILDLSDSTFIDSTGLAVVAKALRKLKASDRSLAIVCVEEIMLEIFTVTGFDDLIPIVPTREEASAALTEAHRR